MDLALGQAASAELEAHLAGCPACSGALAAWRARAGQLDDGVRRAVAVEPPEGAAERVLARVNPGDARPARAWHPRIAAAALAAAAVVLAALHHQRVSRERDRERTELLAAAEIAQWRSPTRGLMRSPAERLLRGGPRLGKGFFEMQSDEPFPKQEKEER